ncbi:MAG: hypothetical protein IKO93_15060 [Lentisphaeria bacterium]|nr:hypothetical protein [Lentisphaeria bacterium]
MSCTILNDIRVYKCNEPLHWNDTLFAVLVNTVESNLSPGHYHYWPLAAGQKFEVIKVFAEKFYDVFSGTWCWHGERNKVDRSMAFLNYALDALENAKELTGAVPELDKYTVLYFEKDAPGAGKLQNFTAMECFKIEKIWNEYRLVIEQPTVSEIYWGQAIRKHYEDSIRMATEPGILNTEELHKCLAEHCWLIPKKYRKPFDYKDE